MGIFGKKDSEVKPPVVHVPAAAKAAPKSSQRNTTLETTYIGKNLSIKGTVSGEGNIIILARITGNVRATDIYVNGNIEGKIAGTEKVQLDNTARIKGGIITPKISILEGAMFDGEIKMSDRTAQAPKPAAPGPKQPTPAITVPDKKETQL
jgi:cytoskeletal protein CcmA (bactofilin family)